jgi:F-type H+-transporting ATPase subunit c
MKRLAKVLLGSAVATVVMLIASTAFAQSTDAMASATHDGWLAIAAGLGIGIAAFGGALGQGRAAASALDGIARNPEAADKLNTPMILGLALIESLVIYALIISIIIVLKVH